MSNLYRDSAATLEQFQNAQTGFQLAEQALQIAGFKPALLVDLRHRVGRVLRKLMNEGELVGPGQPVYVINSTRPGDWVIRIGVADRDWARLSCATAQVWLDAYPGDTLKAEVSEIAEVADPLTGTFSVKLRIEAGERRLAMDSSHASACSPRARRNSDSYPSKPSPPPTATRPRSSACATTARPSKPRTVQVAHILPDRVAVRAEDESSAP